MFASAVKLCQAAGYASAGTVEFLVGPDGQHYFLEVNTRLQVEHPVTECLTGIDIVRHQVELAAGGSLPDRVAPRGHAIEARLNAEDAFSGYLPQTGEILMLEWPHIPGVRVDSGLASGQSVSPHYDSLIAKVIAHGSSRESARRRLIEALREVVVLGVTTNQRFLIELLESDGFRSAETYTTTRESMSFEAPEVPEELRALAQGELGGSVSISEGGYTDVHSPWSRLTDFRMGSTR